VHQLREGHQQGQQQTEGAENAEHTGRAPGDFIEVDAGPVLGCELPLDQHQPAQAPHQVQPQQRQPQSDRRAEILRRSSISRPASPRVSNSQWAASRQLGSSR
jgi:hypothetical protein